METPINGIYFLKDYMLSPETKRLIGEKINPRLDICFKHQLGPIKHNIFRITYPNRIILIDSLLATIYAQLTPTKDDENIFLLSTNLNRKEFIFEFNL